MTGRVSRARRAELLPLVVAAWQREDRPSVSAISRELGLGQRGRLVRSLLREAGIEPERRAPRTAQHGDPGMWQTRRCRCAVCDQARREYRRAREWDRQEDAVRAARVESMRVDRERRQQVSLETARRSGARWTGPEMELVAREDLSATEVAQMIGRTLHAVTHARAALRDPGHRDHGRYRRILDGTL